MGVPFPKTIIEKRIVHDFLKRRPGQVISYTELCERLGLGVYANGTPKKDMLCRRIIKPLCKEYPNIKTRPKGAVFEVSSPIDEMLLTEIASLKNELATNNNVMADLMASVASLIEKVSAPQTTVATSISGNAISGNTDITSTIAANSVSGNAPINRQRSNGWTKPGRPKAFGIDPAALVALIDDAHRQGRPFNVTGKNGMYARRGELPEGFRIGRHSIEDHVKGLLASGAIALDAEGCLFTGSV